MAANKKRSKSGAEKEAQKHRSQCNKDRRKARNKRNPPNKPVSPWYKLHLQRNRLRRLLRKVVSKDISVAQRNSWRGRIDELQALGVEIS